jgi:biotin synthase
MGAAWRGVREVSQLKMEVCVTLGQIGPKEARRLKEAGVTA